MHPFVVQMPPFAHGFGKQLSLVAMVDDEMAKISPKIYQLESVIYLCKL